MSNTSTSERDSTAVLQLLRLSSAGEPLAVPIDAVREILEVGRLTPMPRTPDFVRGVMNLRGSVVPVIDLRARFGLGVTELGRRSAIVVVETQAAEPRDRLIAGLLVDALYEVLQVEERSIEAVPSLGVPVPAAFLAGIVRLREHHTALLALDILLAPDKLAQLIEAHQGEG